MAWTKVKTAIVGGIGILLVAGTVKEVRAHNFDNSWRTKPVNFRKLDQMSPEVRILPSKFVPYGGWTIRGNKIMGVAEPAIFVLQAAYNFNPYTRIVLLAPLPDGSYDFIATLPSGNVEALQKEVERKFGVDAKREIINTNVLLLAVKYPNAPGLRSTKRFGGESLAQGRITYTGTAISQLKEYAEVYLNTPVIDRTGLHGNFAFDLKWDDQWDSNQRKRITGPFKQALLDQLGLELVPTNMPIEMLVVEKAH